MTAIGSEQRLAFFKTVEDADHGAVSKQPKLPSLAPVSPFVKSEDKGNLEHRQKTYKTIHRKRTVLELHVGSRQKQLHQLNPVIFRYLNNEQKTALVQELEETRDLLNRVLYMDAVEDRCDRLAALIKDVQTCQTYIGRN